MRPSVRCTLISLALALAALAGLRLASERDAKAELVRRVTPLAGPATGAALAALRSEPNLAQARGRLARTLVAEALELKPEGPEGRRAVLARLTLAQELALEALAREPINWEAHLALGAATYLQWSIEEDNRLFVEARAWELPLKQARELAPTRPEAARFLALAYMEVWSVLPAWKQEEARSLLRTSFADPGTFERLIGPWLAVAGGLEPALDLVPDEPYAWGRLRQLFGDRHDWPGFARASNELDRLLGERLAASVAAAEGELKRGQAAAARSRLLAVLRQLPVDGRFAPTFVRAMEKLPAGPLDATSEPALAAWLAWAAAEAPRGARPLPPTAVGRLARAVGEVEPPRQALFALLAGDLATAERLELQAPTWPGDWEPYWRTKRTLQGGQGGALSPSLPAADSWPAGAWVRSLRRATLDFQTLSPATGMTLTVAEVPAGGTALILTLDGAGLGTFAVPGPGTPLEVPTPLPPGTHQFTIESVHGEFQVGELTLWR